jgi:ABC-type multidrug transport system fused ATPase/permease subunit
MSLPYPIKSDLQAAIRSAFALLSKPDQRKIKRVAVAQVLLSSLDLLGIALVGLVASLAVTGINSKTPGSSIERLLSALSLGSLPFQTQTALLAALALVVFVIRTIFSMILIRKTLFFLGGCGAEIATDLLGKVLTRPLTELGKYSSQHYIYAVTTGVETLSLRLIGSTVSLVADSALLIFMLVALLYVNPTMTLVVALLVGATSLVLHRLTTARSKSLGDSASMLDISSRESLVDVLTAYREIASKGRLVFYEKEFRNSRHKVSRTIAEYSFMPYVGKYVIETTLMISAFMIAGAQFLLTDATNAITTLSIFMAAGSRLAPAVLRIQHGVVRLNNSWGVADSTLALIDDLKRFESIKCEARKFSNIHLGFSPTVSLTNTAFRYPHSNSQILETTNLVIHTGESVALVGPSGSGKTTLIDLMLGMLVPECGDVKVSGISPSQAILKWPGAIGYVPQEIYVSNGTVAQNIALGFSINEVEEEEIWEALRKAQIAEFIASLEHGIFTNLGDRGLKLSGGQKQRLGIARALLTKPKILFLDEATSALDSQTEYDVSTSINDLKGEVTLICVAHRLSTAKRADRVIYLKAGMVIAQGSFEEVKILVPDFQRQAELMDLG